VRIYFHKGIAVKAFIGKWWSRSSTKNKICPGRIHEWKLIHGYIQGHKFYRGGIYWKMFLGGKMKKKTAVIALRNNEISATLFKNKKFKVIA
jgi:hypothetical protein